MIKKIGPSLAIFSGTIVMIFAIIGLLVAQGVIDNHSWFGTYSKQIDELKATDLSASITYGITIAIGFGQFLLGILAWKKSRGIAAFILLLLITTAAVFNIVSGVRSNNFPIAIIISISISCIAALGMTYGLLIKE